MIRNYYTEAYKGGIVPAISVDNLIDGTPKVTQTFTDANTLINAATSVTITLTAINNAVKRGMYITAPANGAAPAWTINDHIMVEAVSNTATQTIITISTPKALVAGTTLTFFTIKQSSWKEYNLFIGTAPAASSVSVLTIDNQTLTITNPAAGFVLPLSVVQITGVAGGLTNLIALN
tara:strand:+ start:505 stop:1038 length:534 start_codon:yes stop_codon:yes gene_type:complete